MGEKAWSALTGLTSVLAAYFLVVGERLHSEPPTAAEGAVGLGIAVLGGGFAITAFIAFCAWMSMRNARLAAEGEPEQPPTT